jgi:hypothetical protein
MTVTRERGCACRAVRYRLTLDSLFVHCCHCLNCQRQTGSAFVINVLIETDRVELLAGDPEPVPVPRSGGKKQKIWRCPTCQVAVFSRYRRRGIRFVRAGTLDDPAAVEPDVHSVAGRRATSTASHRASCLRPCAWSGDELEIVGGNGRSVAGDQAHRDRGMVAAPARDAWRLAREVAVAPLHQGDERYT